MTLDVPPPAALPAPVACAQTNAEFQALLDRYETPIFQYVQQMMGTGADDAADLTQDVFVKAWLAMRAGRYAEEGKLTGWLYRIAANVCFDEMRHRKVLKWVQWDTFTTWLLHIPRQQVSRAGAFTIPDHAVTWTLSQERAEAVHETLGALPDKYRAVLILREFHDLSYAELAAALETTVSAIKARLFRARQEFARIWPTVKKAEE